MTYQYIIFDLDDTLYPRSSGLMKEIARRIQRWLQQTFDLTQEEAKKIQHRYLRRYGTTLAGLIAEGPKGTRDIDTDDYTADDGYVTDYLLFVHDIPIDVYLKPSPALREMLQAIPLRKAIYTNGTSAYAQRVLRVLSVLDHFEHIIGIEEVGLRNKTDRRAYEQALAILDIPGSACIMVEDTLNNLAAAKALDMTTILVDGQPNANVDISVSDVLKVGQAVSSLLNKT